MRCDIKAENPEENGTQMWNSISAFYELKKSWISFLLAGGRSLSWKQNRNRK